MAREKLDARVWSNILYFREIKMKEKFASFVETKNSNIKFWKDKKQKFILWRPKLKLSYFISTKNIFKFFYNNLVVMELNAYEYDLHYCP